MNHIFLKIKLPIFHIITNTNSSETLYKGFPYPCNTAKQGGRSRHFSNTAFSNIAAMLLKS